MYKDKQNNRYKKKQPLTELVYVCMHVHGIILLKSIILAKCYDIE